MTCLVGFLFVPEARRNNIPGKDLLPSYVSRLTDSGSEMRKAALQRADGDPIGIISNTDLPLSLSDTTGPY